MIQRASLSLLVALAAVALYWPAVREVPFYNSPEPLEALVVWEMVEGGDWVLPRRNGEEIPAKPPLYHWVGATLSTWLGRVDELSTRLPSLGFGALTVGLTFGVASAHWGVGAGLASAVVLATSPEWARWAVTARTDAMFAFFVTLAFVLGERWCRAPGPGRLVAFAAAAAAATLTKGPAGALLPGLVVIAGRRGRQAVREAGLRRLLIAAAVFLGIAGSWYVAALWRGGFEFFQKQILFENVFRLLPHEDWPSRQRPFYFYIPAIAVGMIPWSLALPFAIRGAVRERETPPQAELRRYLVSCLAVVFVVCSLASGKRSNYVLPLYPAAAILIGVHLSGFLAAASRRRASTALVAGGTIAASLLVAVAAILFLWRLGLEPWAPFLPLLHVRDREILPLVTDALGPPGAWVVGTTAALAALLAWTSRRGSASGVGILFAGTALLATLVGAALVRPAEARLKTFEPFALEIATRIEDAEAVTFFRRPQYAVLFYLRRHVQVEYVSFDSVRRPGWALVWEDDWNALPAASRRGAALVESSPRAAPDRPDSRLFLLRLEPVD